MTVPDDDRRWCQPASRTRARRLAAAALALLGVGGGCGSSGAPGAAGEVGTYTPDAGGAFVEGDASASSGLDAHIEENHVTITFVTLSCADRCAVVQAVATGGHPPYAYAWDDGTMSASRTVCPAADTSYAVTVTDTATTGEFATAAQTVKVPLEANVIACPDAASPPPMPPDASPPPWTGCEMASGASEGCYLDGGTVVVSWQVPLTQPLRAGSSYEFTMQVGTTVPTASNYQLHVEGSNGAACDADDVLAVVPFAVTNLIGGTVPVQFCATATADTADLLVGIGFSGSGGIGTSTLTVQTCAVTSCADGGP